MRILYSVFAILLAIASAYSYAENVQDRWDAEDKNRWSGFLSANYSKNNYADSQALANRDASLTAIIRYRLAQDTRLQLIVGGHHVSDADDYLRQGDFLYDTSLTVSQNNLWNPHDKIKMNGSVRAIFPTSKESQRQDLDFALRASVRFSFVLDNYIDGLYLNDYIRVQKNFHEFETAGKRVLDEYRFSNTLSLDYYFLDDWSFSGAVTYRKTLKYNNSSYSPSVYYSAQFGYQWNDDLDFAYGISNSTSYANPEQGPHPVDDLFDLDKINFYLTVNYKL